MPFERIGTSEPMSVVAFRCPKCGEPLVEGNCPRCPAGNIGAEPEKQVTEEFINPNTDGK